jgi:parallel beta-helix repeat protein
MYKNKKIRFNTQAALLALVTLSLPIIFFGLKYTTLIPLDVFASGGSYFVSPSGNDSSSGSKEAPFKTFAKAVNSLQPGDTLYIMGGTYKERLVVPKVASNQARISILPYANQKVTIDLENSAEKNIDVTGKYITVENIEVKNSNGMCVYLGGQYNTLKSLSVHDCANMGIYTDGQNNIIDSNTVYLTNLENKARSKSSGWGSAVKVKVGGQNITIQNNNIYNNYGEGIAVTRGVGALVRGNTLRDNYAVNIYIDNSKDVIVEKNFSYCTPNSGFEKTTGNAAHAIGMGEESYSGWGAQLANITIKNNILAFCYKGVSYFGADVSGGGLDNVLVANNTIYGSTSTAISLEKETAKTRNTKFVNNIVGQPQNKLAWISGPDGISFQNNYWIGSKPSSDTGVRSTNDKNGDSPFVVTPNTTTSSFKVKAGSSVVGTAQKIDTVIDDFESKLRYTSSNPASDIGAFELIGDQNAGQTPTPTPISPSPTNNPTTTPTVTPKVTSNTNPKITTWYLPSGRVGKSYKASVTGFDIDTSDTLSITAGGLPAGLEIKNCITKYSTRNHRPEIGCQVIGTPTERFKSRVTFTIIDNNNGSSSKSYSLTVK